MALQVNGGNPGMIGRMFARQNVSDLYSRQRTAAPTEESRSNQLMDSVDLSPYAPKPLEASLVEDSGLLAEKIASGKTLDADERNELREDRVLAAVTTLMAIGADPDIKPLGWPGGMPEPSEAEMQAAYRRLTQRLDRPGDAENPEKTARMRTETLDNLRKIDAGQLTSLIAGVM